MSLLYCAYNKRISEELIKKLQEPFEHAPSSEQESIFYEFEHGTGNVVVIARAGVGKTTTGIAGVRKAPEGQSIEVKTLHAVGLAIVKTAWERIGVDFGSKRADDLAFKVCTAKAPDAIRRLVSKLHTKGREIKPHARVLGDLTELAYKSECEPDEQFESMGFGLGYVEAKALEAMELAATVRPESIDGPDMIFLPVRNRWITKKYDAVVVDEAQDMTEAMLEIAQGVCRGRIFLIGDDKQAIYGFRGADSQALGRLQRELGAKELKLTTTYRCGQSIVRLAQELVPDFKAGPNNPEGRVYAITPDKLRDAAGPGDFVLSRLNAPLVSIAMQMLRAGKRTRVAGRDIGKGLVGLVRKLNAKSVPDFLKRVSTWEKNEVDRLLKLNESDTRAARIEGIQDQAQMLIDLADGAKNVTEVTDRIESLFTDDGLGDAGMITCSSVHRSKGLEANRVFIIENTLRYGSEEEDNIRYVAITRAKRELVWVRQEVA